MLAAIAFVSPLVACADWTGVPDQERTPLPEGAKLVKFEARNGTEAVRGYAVTFNSKSSTLQVIDGVHASDGPISQQLESAGCYAGVNGSYFHPDYRPIGLVISDGEERHAFEKAKLLSGVLYADPRGIHLVRSSEYRPGKAHAAIQAGPFLVDDGKPVRGLDPEKPARRTVVLTDGKGRWALVYLSYVTLADAGKLLAVPGLIDGITPVRALNLDGGSSSAIWAATQPQPFRLSPFGKIRNLVGVSPR